MCNPALIALAITAAGTGVSMVAQNEQSKATAKAIEAQNQVQADEIADQASVEINERNREAYREMARIRVASGESGLAGASLDQAIGNVLFQRDFDNALTIKGESNRQRARTANTNSALSRLQIHSTAGIVVNSALAGGSAYANAGGDYGLGKKGP